MERGEGPYLYDTSNNQYIDLTAGIAVNSLGHCPPLVTHALMSQASVLVHSSNMYYNKFAPVLSEILVDATKESGGMIDAHSVFLSNSGTESNEAALKFARKHAKVVGDEKKTGLVSFKGAFHGRSFGSLSMTPNPKYQTPFSPLLPDVTYGTFNDVAGLQNLITKNTAGVIVEPIQGEGGINVATQEFVVALRKRCNEVNAVLIYDEIQCGLSRTGKLWAHSHFGNEASPDIITVAKALGNGFPIGAVIVNEKVNSAIKVGDHGTTYGGNPLAARVAIEVLKELNSKALLEGVSKRARSIEQAFDTIIKNYPNLATERRGLGLIQGLQLTINPSHVIKLAHDRGLLLLSCGTNTLRLVPPLNIPLPVLSQGLKVLKDVFKIIQKDIDGK